MTNGNKTTFKGTFKNNKRHGYGKSLSSLTILIGTQGLANGGRLEGEWKNDQRHGKMSKYGQSFYGWMYNKMYKDGEELDLCTCEDKNPLDHG